MNPTVNVTYDILDKFLSEMIALFPPPFLHLGGDEVPEKCWLSDKDVVAWMARHGMGLNANELESYFVNRVASLSGVKDSGRLIMSVCRSALTGSVARAFFSILRGRDSLMPATNGSG